MLAINDRWPTNNFLSSARSKRKTKIWYTHIFISGIIGAFKITYGELRDCALQKWNWLNLEICPTIWDNLVGWIFRWNKNNLQKPKPADVIHERSLMYCMLHYLLFGSPWEESSQPLFIFIPFLLSCIVKIQKQQPCFTR